MRSVSSTKESRKKKKTRRITATSNVPRIPVVGARRPIHGLTRTPLRRDMEQQPAVTVSPPEHSVGPSTVDASSEQDATSPLPTEKSVPVSKSSTGERSCRARLSFSRSDEDDDEDKSVHGFNVSNVTVIENVQVTVATPTAAAAANVEPIDKTALKLNLDGVAHELSKTSSNGTNNDGSDSGVELCGPNFQRTFSDNSGCCSVDDYTVTSGMSCDSSIVSCCSNYDVAFELLAGKNSTLIEDLSWIGDGTSEGGSESSSLAGGGLSKMSATRRAPLGSIKKKVAVNEPLGGQARPARSKNGGNSSPTPTRSRSRTASHRATPRTPSTATTSSSASSTVTKSRTARPGTVNSGAVDAKYRTPSGKPPPSSAHTKTKNGPDALLAPPARKDTSLSRGRGHARKNSVAGRNSGKPDPLTPTDDRRWPSVGCKPTPPMARSLRGTSVTSDVAPSSAIKSRSMESKASALEKYATLPRRKREKTPPDVKDDAKVVGGSARFVSRSRDASLNRIAVTLKRQTLKERDGAAVSTPSGKTMPPYPKKKICGSTAAVSKVKIYHETGVQTAIAMCDVEGGAQGILSRTIDPEDVEMTDSYVQVDRRHEAVETLESRLKELTEANRLLRQNFEATSKKLADAEKSLATERDERRAVQDELERNTKRVIAILDSDPTCEGVDHTENGTDSLLALESQFQKAGQIIVKQEDEISQLHGLCRHLQRDLEKSKATERSLIEQQHDMETESSELQEFIQAEKSALAEVLHDTEKDVQMYRQRLRQKEIDLQRQQDECKHLVRVSEQRRQENLALQARLGGAETRSRELLLQHGASISSASVALSGLSSRLENLVDTLVAAYNISEQDLEDVIYHNEAYSNSESSETSPDRSSSSRKSPESEGRTLSPNRGASFITAVISAIRNAASQNPFSGSVAGGAADPTTRPSASDDRLASEYDTSDSAELLDSETEPILMMENVLEDVTLPDTHTHNMVSSTHSLLMSSRLGHSESLQNLSQAIITRQEQERLQRSATEMAASSAAVSSECCAATTLVDQVIDVDNLVTRLLKILRIIQMENDTYVEDIQEERSTLSEQVQKQREACESAAKQLREWELMGTRLKTELDDVKKLMNAKTAELDETRADLAAHRKEVERLNEDVCKLSTLCSQTELQLRNREEEANDTLKQWQETGKLPSADVLARLVTARHEIPVLKEKLAEKEKQLAEITEKFSTSQQKMSESWCQASSETRRQYEAIDSALETFLSIQSVVEKCPPLAKLQRDLEETSFKYASSFPMPLVVVAPDCNANANHHLETSSPTAINGTA